jgi:arylsulfatase A-like enzyme
MISEYLNMLFQKIVCIVLMLLPVVHINAQKEIKKPNVLFIAIDDMNDWTTLFDKDNPIKTPNIERLAERGVFFNHAYCTSAACNPSRAAIMTGISPYNSGVYGNHDAWRKLVPDAITFPRYFMQNGYSAKGSGKIFHHGEAGLDNPDHPSFEEFFDMLPTRAPKQNYNGYRSGNLSKVWFDWGEHDQKMIDIDAVEYAEKVMEEKTDKPLILGVGIFKPHLPFYAPKETFKKYPFNKTKIPPFKDNDLDDVPEIGKNMALKEEFIYTNTCSQPENSPGSLKKMIQCYQASADFADQMVGRLLDKLDETGMSENTIIVLYSDHGYHLGDKQSCVKFTLWEKANHVPFIIAVPQMANAGKVCEQPVSLLDIYPTLLELCGLEPSKEVDGKSLVPLLENVNASWEQPALMTMGRGNHAVRSKRWRYIRYSDGSEELYDHQNDPWEWNNLAADSKYERVIAEHKKWLPAHEIPWLIDESQNWIYRRVEWNDVPANEKK